MALIGTIKYLQIGSNTYEIPTGSTVSITRNLTSGTKSATINIDGIDYDIYSVTNTDSNVSQTNTTTSAAYRLLLSSAANDTTATAGAQKSSYLTYNPSTKALVTNGTINGFTLAAACAKAIDSSISAGSTSTNLPTSAAVANFVGGLTPTQAAISNTGLITFKNSSGTSLFTLQLPLYNGGVS